MNIEIFVENVKKYCKARGTTPTAAAEESGAGRNFMDNIKKGSIPSVAKVQMLADYLGVTTSELLGEELPFAGKDLLMAAFWGGEKDLTNEDKDAMWADVERFAQFLAEKKKQEKQNG